jgi:hypothetical protein
MAAKLFRTTVVSEGDGQTAKSARERGAGRRKVGRDLVFKCRRGRGVKPLAKIFVRASHFSGALGGRLRKALRDECSRCPSPGSKARGLGSLLKCFPGLFCVAHCHADLRAQPARAPTSAQMAA